ncbi:MAG: lipopolysaccharide biosynthesis protein [Fibrobacteria bacterium]
MTASASGRISGLLGHSAAYAVANILQRGLAFVLIPIYATYFSAAEFGAMDILYQAVITLSLAASLGLPQGMVRGFFPPDGKDPATDAERKRILGALTTLLIPLSVVLTAAVLIFSGPLARVLLHGEGKPTLIRLSAWFYLALAVQQVPLQYLRTVGRSKAYAAWLLAGFILAAAGNLIGIAILHIGVEGMLWGNLLGTGLTAVGMWLTAMPRTRLNFEWSVLRPLFAFGMPMLPNLLCRRALETASRYILPLSWGLSELGIFSMGARVSAILEMMILLPFMYAWQPFFYGQARRPDAPRVFAQVTHYVLVVMCAVLVALQWLQDPILEILGRGKYAAAAPVATWLAISVSFSCMQSCVAAGVHLGGKLVAEMILMAISAAISIAGNLLLTPRWGAAGAAASTAAGYAFYLVASWFLAKRAYPIPYLWGRGAWIASLALAAGWLAGASHSAWVKPAALIAFLILGPGFDLWKHGELARAATWLARRRRKPVAQAETAAAASL